MEGLNNRAATRVAQNALPPLIPRVQGSNKSLIIPLPSSQESPGSGQDKGTRPDSNTETQVPQERDSDPNVDPKKHKRVVASRQYSQKYRFKQLQYIGQLETEVKALQAQVAIASPRIKYGDRQNSLLRAENSSMKQKLSAFSGELLFKQAQYEELKKERDALKLFSEAYQKQVADMIRNPYGGREAVKMEVQTRKTMGIGLQEIPARHKTTSSPPSSLEMVAPSNPTLGPSSSFQVWTTPYLTMNLDEAGTGASNPTSPVLSLNTDGHYQNTQDHVSLLPNKDPSSINGAADLGWGAEKNRFLLFVVCSFKWWLKVGHCKSTAQNHALNLLLRENSETILTETS
ncbi:hypothetical protein FNV43_RR05333 [Rhamnella rubrinervis]|uniref:BZIP domain-containing protein n=1 Tax=Rhamnella rubrinervis TaxID=2594499 RepID=A0A8K0HLY8_9ROSA|nr:hypothetical protein FNV43_RR05333 [Rhamnella rubrinervis]